MVITLLMLFGYDVFTKTMSNIAFDIENDFDSQIHTDNNVAYAGTHKKKSRSKDNSKNVK